MTIRIVLADDHKIVRDGLTSMLQAQPDMDVVAQADNGRSAVQMAEELRPDVVVMDAGMPDLNGIQPTRQVTEAAPGVRVIALSMHSDRRFVEGMLSAGAAGYVLKDSAFEELATAIRTVVDGQTYLCPTVTGIVVANYVRRRPGPESTAHTALTPREREVLQLLAEGKATKQVASRLGVSVKTLETHRSRIMEKLGIHSIAELTKYAIREGLTSLES